MKLLSKVLSFVLVLCICLGCVPVISMAEDTITSTHITDVPAGYIGIYTKYDLDNIRNNLTKKYILMNDIVFSDADFQYGGDFYNDGQGWEPIGDKADGFKGEFNGNKFRVINLYINRPDQDYVGLFGYEYEGKITTLNLENANIIGKDYVGGIVGMGWFGTFYKCDFKGTVNGENYVGGILGKFKYGKVNNCSSRGTINGSDYVGGCIGIFESTDSDEKDYGAYYCSNVSTVNGKNYVGGIVGCMRSNFYGINMSYEGTNYIRTYLGPITSRYCLNSGSINASASCAGGIVGCCDYTSNMTYHGAPQYIYDSYNIGDVFAADYAGGLVGRCDSFNTKMHYSYSIGNVFSNNHFGGCFANSPYSDLYCYYLVGSVTEPTYDKDGTAKTADELKTLATFKGWNFSTTWIMAGRDDYPYPELRSVPCIFPEDNIHSHQYVSKILSLSTHTENGVEAFVCECGDAYTRKIEKLPEHTFIQEVTPPTCTEEGFTTYTCECGESYTADYVGATDHVESDWIIDVDANCTKDGSKHKECTVCGDLLATSTILAKGHTEAKDDAVLPTCTEKGKTEGSHCSVCNVVIVAQSVLPSTGHSYTAMVTTPATHLSSGILTYTCHCGDTYTEVIPKIAEHSYTAKITEPTCTARGYTTYICECGSSYVSDYINAKGHSVTVDEKFVPTCTTDGKTAGSHCSVCGLIIEAQQTIPATGHSHTSVVTTPATHLTTGVKTFTCHCGDMYTEVIPKTTEHSYSTVITAPTCTEKGYTTYTCECGSSYTADYVNAKGHTASDWLIENHATCTVNGSKNKKCIICAETLETAIIFATGHTVSEWKYNAEKRLEYKECTVCKEILDTRSVPLSSPQITSCYNEVNGVQLKWTTVTDGQEYKIFRKLPSENEWTLITTTSALAYQDTAVTGNTVYQYSIKAVDQYGNESNFSTQRECRFIETPTLLTRENAVGGVKITWSKVEGATSYRIYRRGAGTNYWFYLGDFPATLDTFTDLETANYFPENPSKNEQAKPKSGNYYRYTIRASYDGEDSSGNPYLIYSGFDTNGLYLKYVATPKLTSISNATNGLQIKWNAVNGGGDTEYRVYRRGAGATYWYYLGTTTGTTWIDSGVKSANGNYYRYTVRAVAGKDGKGWYSAFDTTGLFLMRLSNPTLNSAVSSSSGITVKWGSVKGATSYYVYRKTASSSWTRIAVVSGNTNTTYLDKTAKKGTTYTYTVRAVYGGTISYFNSGISCKDKY